MLPRPALAVLRQPDLPETFATFKAVFSSLPAKVVLAGLIWAYSSLCAGIRFLLLDCISVSRSRPANKSAAVVLAVSIPLTLVLWGFCCDQS